MQLTQKQDWRQYVKENATQQTLRCATEIGVLVNARSTRCGKNQVMYDSEFWLFTHSKGGNTQAQNFIDELGVKHEGASQDDIGSDLSMICVVCARTLE